MKKIKLNDSLLQQTSADEYVLDPTEKYVIDLEILYVWQEVKYSYRSRQEKTDVEL